MFVFFANIYIGPFQGLFVSSTFTMRYVVPVWFHLIRIENIRFETRVLDTSMS